MRGIFERHDRYNFEAKIDYTLDARQPKNKYFLSFYFFIPKSLNLGSKNYSRSDFYADMHTYIRFKNPRFTLDELLDKSNKRSPLCQIFLNVDNLRRGISLDEVNRKLIYELRMFGTIFKTCLREETLAITKILSEEAKSGGKNSDILTGQLLTRLNEVEEQFEIIQRNFEVSGASRELQETYVFARDMGSLEVQNYLTLLLGVYRKRRGKSAKKLIELIISFIENHWTQRRRRGSHLVRDPDSLNENFTYWEGILKKYFQGVLYLTVRDKNSTGRAQHIVYGIAAGFAMFLSLVIGYWLGTQFTSELSTSFIVAVVVGYIIKDRTKDIIRNYSNTFLRFFVPDRKFVIVDPMDRRNIGVVRESMRFVDLKDAPPPVLQARTSGHMTCIEEEGKPEEILMYQKDVVIDTEKISRYHTRRRDISDIIRFNIRKLIQYADDPFHFDKMWDSASKKIKRLKCAKVYHLNLIIRLETMDAKERKQVVFKHVRVILNQDGIVRMGEVQPAR